jgi:hypothetical protein
MIIKILGSGSNGINPREGVISDESPIGKALMERSVGDVVEVETPAGVQGLKILEISKEKTEAGVDMVNGIVSVSSSNAGSARQITVYLPK